MKKTPQQSQLKSTSSTRASQLGTPIKFDHSTHLASTLFMGKRFIRKRDSSTQSLKRSQLATPKSNNSSMAIKSSRDSQNNEQKQANLSKLSNTDTFMRGFKSPSFLKISGSFRLAKAQDQNNNQLHQTQQPINKISVLQNNNDSHKITRSGKDSQKSFKHFRVLSSSRNLNNCNNSKESASHNQNYVENYSCPQTERQSMKRNESDAHSELKVLESELLILQDQNTRLKKQIGNLTNQRDNQKKLRLQISRKLQSSEKKLRQNKQKTSQIYNTLGMQISQIQQQLINKLTSNREFSKKVDDIHKDNCINWQQFSSTFKEHCETQQSQLQYFVEQFWNPIRDSLIDNIDRSARVVSQLMNSLSKLEIKQNMICRNEFQLVGVKNELKIMNGKLTLQKQRADRYKQMNNKLKKELAEYKSKKQSKSFKIGSDGMLSSRSQNKLCDRDDDVLSLILSDDDDSFNVRSSKVNKVGSF